MSEKKKIRKWRTNCVVTYLNQCYAGQYREQVLSVLRNIAQLRGIESEIKVEYPFVYGDDIAVDSDLREFVSDLVYFRSTENTKISSKEFRELIEHIFEEQRVIGLRYSPFEIVFQMQKFLHLYPYPDD